MQEILNFDFILIELKYCSLFHCLSTGTVLPVEQLHVGRAYI